MKHTPTLTQGQTLFGWCYWLATQSLVPFLLAKLLLFLPVSTNGGTWQLCYNLSFFAVNFAVLLVAYRRFLGRQFSDFWSEPFQCLGWTALFILLYYLASLATGWLISRISPTFQNANNGFISGLVQRSFLLTLVGTVLLVPLAEEMLYRGVIFGSLKRFGRPVSYLASVALFSFVHIVNYLGDPGFGLQEVLISLLQYAIPSLCLSLAYDLSGNLFCPILIHSLNNLFALLEMR